MNTYKVNIDMLVGEVSIFGTALVTEVTCPGDRDTPGATKYSVSLENIEAENEFEERVDKYEYYDVILEEAINQL